MKCTQNFSRNFNQFSSRNWRSSFHLVGILVQKKPRPETGVFIVTCNRTTRMKKKLFHHSLQHILRFQVLARQAVKVLPAVAQPASYSLENLKGCCDTPDPESQNSYDKEQSQIRLSSRLKSSTQIKLLLEVNRIDHNKEDIDEQAKIHLDKVHNHLHNCLDGLSVHEPFMPTSEMLESRVIIMIGEN